MWARTLLSGFKKPTSLFQQGVLSPLSPLSTISSFPRLFPASSSSVSQTIAKRYKHEYAPRYKRIRKQFKGRVSVRTGGSLKGNSVEFGEVGLRLKSNGVRMSALQLKEADKAIQRLLRGTGASLVTRFVCNIAVCVKGNQTRMGKGKGSFEYWACRVPTGKVLFEIQGNVHEHVARDAFISAAKKLPGLYEIVTKESKVRVSPTVVIDKPEPVNYIDLMNKKPSKKWANIQASKLPEYMMFRGR